MVCCVWILMVSHHWWPFTLKLHFLGRTLDNTMSDSHTQESRQFCGGGWEGGGWLGWVNIQILTTCDNTDLRGLGFKGLWWLISKIKVVRLCHWAYCQGKGPHCWRGQGGGAQPQPFRHCQLSRNNNYLKLCASWNQESPISNHYWWQKLARYYTRGHDRILGWSVTATLKLSWFNSAVEILPRWQAGKNIVITPLHPPSRFVVAPQIAGR